jgi:hypothetical protein
MKTTTQVSDLIAGIYDAALAPEKWTAVLQDTCNHVGGAAAMLFEHDAIFLEGRRLRAWNDDPHYTEVYFSQYLDLNPSSRPQGDVPLGLATSISGLVGVSVMQSSEFYNDWMKPQGYVDNIFANLLKSATRAATIGIARGRSNGLATPAALGRMQDLVGHFGRAVLISY